jgi:hypothetical protein
MSDDTLQLARQRDPLKAPWGLFLAPEGGDESLLWFADRNSLEDFVAKGLWPALAGVEPSADTASELAALFEADLPLSWAALEQANLLLEPLGRLHWWGSLTQLYEGEDPFAKDLREAFREQAGDGTQNFSALAAADQARFAKFLQEVFLNS